MHNLGVVFNFEVIRALKKKSFWVMALLFPVLIAAVFSIIYFSSRATDQISKDLGKQQFSIGITDKSGLIEPALAKSLDAKTFANKDEGISGVKNGKIDAFFYYPENLQTDKVEVFGKDVGIFEDSKYESVAKSLLSSSVSSTVSPTIQLVLKGGEASSSTYYRDGQVYDPIKQMIFPGIFLVLFYLLIAFFGGQMLTATTEEKENRVIEMLLTTIEARTLIVGKLLALVSLSFLQAAIMATPILVGYLLLRDKLSLPSIDLSTLPVDWVHIGLGALIFILSYLMFTGFLVLVGSMVPTAKEAGQFFGILMVLLFGPLYAVTLFISAPTSGIVTFLTLFPLTAPIPLMLRNAVGNLTGWEAGLSLVILAVTAVIVLALAVRAFRYGALEYSRKLSFKEIVRR